MMGLLHSHKVELKIIFYKKNPKTTKPREIKKDVSSIKNECIIRIGFLYIPDISKKMPVI